jgi:hypothetical protein
MGLLPAETYSYQILAALFFGCIILLSRQLKTSRNDNPKGLPLPPGPKGYPLIGSLFDMPISKPWLVYDDWRKTYGKCLIIDSLLLQRCSFFNRWYDIFQCPWPPLLENRSSNYSDRMRLPMLLDLYVSDFLHLKPCENKTCFRVKMYFNFSILPYDERWRRRRRTFHHYFNNNAVSKYLPIQRREVHAFLRRLLDTPENFLHHIRQ